MAGTAYRFVEKGRISGLQLFFLIVTVVISTADVLLPAYVYQEAAQDSWISVIIGTLTSLIFILIFLHLGLKYPDKTLMQYSCDLLGNPLGKAVGAIYLYYFLCSAKLITRKLAELIVISFNPDAPIVIYVIITLLVAAYAVSQGLEVIARVNQLLLPFGFLLIVLISMVNLPEMDLKNFLPILEKGLVPPLRGAFLIQAWFLESVLVLQLVPYVRERQSIRKYMLFFILAIFVGLMLGTSIVAVFGPLSGKLLFPALEFVRYAKIGRYMQNLDISIMGLWTTGIFIKIAVFMYVSFHGLVQLLELKDGKRLLLPLILLTFGMAVSDDRFSETYQTTHYIFPFCSLLVGVVLPVILLIASAIRRTVKKGGKCG